MHRALLSILSILYSLTLQAQVFQNASFSETDTAGHLASWICRAGVTNEKGKQNQNSIIKLDATNAHTAPGCAYIYNQTDVISNLRQTAPLKPGGIKKYRIHFFARTETRRGWAEAWVTMKDAKEIFVRKEALTTYITGKTAWTPYYIDITSTADVAYVEVGLQFSAPGKVWFDDVSIEELPDNGLIKKEVGPAAKQYLQEVIDVIRTQSFYADSANLEEVHKRALDLIPGAETTGDAYEGVAYILERVGDPLAQFYDPATTRKWWKEQKINDIEALYPTAKMTDSGFVLIWLPGVTSLSKDVLHRYADTLHQQLRALDQNKIKGWILDLRENVGGNATAMLAAIGPLLNNGTHGKYIRSRETVGWKYKNGKASIDTAIVKAKKAFKPKNQKLPVAILTSQETYGAGELVVVAFKGRNNTRFFGEKTKGAPRNEKRITLSDKAMLFFTAGIMEDTKGQRYQTGILPDMHIRMIYKTDVCMERARLWLKEQTK